MRDVDPTIPVTNVRSMDDIVQQSFASRRFTMQLLRVFGVVALFLASLGVYGVLSLSVGRRQQEIGLRKALGALPAMVLRPVLREAVVMTLAVLIGRGRAARP